MISPYKITWDGLSSLDLDLNLYTELSIGGGDNGTTSSFLNREAVTSERFDGSHKPIHSFKYQDVLSPTITFIKQNYGDFSHEENRRMLSWLTSNTKPAMLEIFHDNSEVVSYKMFGGWTEVEQHKLANGRVIGYTTTFTSQSPYAFSQNFVFPEVHETIEEISNNSIDNDWLPVIGTESFTIDCETDEYGKLLYPKVTIQFYGDTIPINEWNDGKDVLHNVIYEIGDKYYTNIPSVYNGDLYKDFYSSPKDTTISSDYVLNNRYFWFRNDKAIYRAIRVCTKATTYDEGITYYEDNKGLIVADPQPISEADLQDKIYYIQSQDADGNQYVWELVSLVGTGIRIENQSVKNSLNENIITELVGCSGTPDGSLGEEIILDGANKVVSSSIKLDTTFGRTFGNDFNWVWPPLSYGENNFVVTGKCKIRFEWIEPRKVGSL